jgi:GNAT superfamily N-acetyltransferase
MEIFIKEVKTKSDLKAFIHLPKKIHKGHKNWVPPLYIDDWEFFDPKKNKSFQYCDHVKILAYKNGEIVGRCMGLVHHKYNKQHNENCGRFSFIETWNDEEVFHALIDYVAKWAKAKGMSQLVGPLAFSDKDPQGFLTDGFDEPIVMASNCNYPYMVELTEKEGFVKKADLVVYKIAVPDTLPPIYIKVAERFAQNQTGIKIEEYTSRAKLRTIIRPILHLINNTFTDVYGFTPFSEKEMDDFANRYIFFINPRFVKVAKNENNEVIGTIIAMSDISKGIQKSKGYVLPFGIFHILASGKKSNQLNLLLGAVDPRYQGRGLEVIMGIKMLDSARKEGKTVIDSHLELETNTKVRAEMERMGGVVYKKYRIFQKDL